MNVDKSILATFSKNVHSLPCSLRQARRFSWSRGTFAGTGCARRWPTTSAENPSSVLVKDVFLPSQGPSNLKEDLWGQTSSFATVSAEVGGPWSDSTAYFLCCHLTKKIGKTGRGTTEVPVNVPEWEQRCTERGFQKLRLLHSITSYQRNGIKAAMRYHLPVRTATITKSTDDEYWTGCGEKGTFLHC